MFCGIKTLTTLVLLMATLVNGHGPKSNRKPNRLDTCQYNLWTLSTLIKGCEKSFMCGVNTEYGRCVPNCVGRDKLCDGHNDCGNGKDENNCSECDTTCEPMEFTCMVEGKKTCFPLTARCDGTSSCDQGEDENNCPTVCTAGQVRCSTNETICAVLCDGIPECPANSVGYVQDEPTPNCGCHIDQTSPTKCDAFESDDDYNVIVNGSEFGMIISICQGTPECTGVIFNGNQYYAVTDDIDAVTGEACSTINVRVYQCQAI